MKKEFLNLPFEVKSVEEKEKNGQKFGVVKGFASTFGNIDDGGDRVMPGAFTETIKDHLARKRQIRMLFQHSSSEIIGGFPVFEEQEKGLYVEGDINLAVQRGKEVFALAKQGVLSDFSIGYWTKGREWVMEDGKDILNLTNLDLAEVSIVGNPMNDQAVITDVKSMTDISKYLKSLGLSNKQSNEVIYKIKSLSRNENNGQPPRNECEEKVNGIVLSSKIDEILNNLKG